ncbi:hypothetical protein PoB_001330700 [Plakobranchus ocellatus]|uniref:Uncharacterized protein n=1 Tax=Plakobranchus ocellatus TaxID=259542 RepID=A0AAV3YWS2_9GAST|nr:hypothetical protein PoB_001330700 [Plakobranchus ocellatus]
MTIVLCGISAILWRSVLDCEYSNKQKTGDGKDMVYRKKDEDFMDGKVQSIVNVDEKKLGRRLMRMRRKQMKEKEEEKKKEDGEEKEQEEEEETTSRRRKNRRRRGRKI